VGVNTSADWKPDPDGVVREAATDYLPTAEVERVEPNEDISDVAFEMESLARADFPVFASAQIVRPPFNAPSGFERVVK
jgi:hypothetical protein